MKTFLGIAAFLIQLYCYGQHSLRVEILNGPAYNFKVPLYINQGDLGTWKQTAKYNTYPFKLPPYYDIRVMWWGNDKTGIGIKFVHHKLILSNPEGPVQFFEITHGYNVLAGSVTRHFKLLDLSAALGIIVAHPQSTINGLQHKRPGFWEGGYVIGGVASELAVSKTLTLWKNLYGLAELRGMAGWAKVPVQNGYAEAPNLSMHALIGLGYRIKVVSR